MFAHSPTATAEASRPRRAAGLPRWAKLSPNVADLVEIAGAALGAGAEALTLVNTLLGHGHRPRARRRPVLGAGGGGLSGPAIHPVAVRAVFECRAAFPGAGIVGVGGWSWAPTTPSSCCWPGPTRVQVGTATFRDPRAPWKVLDGIGRWCRRRGVRSLDEVIGGAHGQLR